MSQPLDELTDMLRQLPGIGPRQARRLAFFLARKDLAWVQQLSRTLIRARDEVRTCATCFHLYQARGATANVCDICANPQRDHSVRMVVEKDVDLENIERTGVYRGVYFVLGGTTSMLDKHPAKNVRIHELERQLAADGAAGIKELVFALSATTEGEDTEAYIRERLASLVDQLGCKITVLGRGLSTGTELEYIDADTMRNAFAGRH